MLQKYEQKIFSPSDSFTDTSIGSNRVNGEHKEKVLQRWEGGDSNGENYDLDNDTVSSKLASAYGVWFWHW